MEKGRALHDENIYHYYRLIIAKPDSRIDTYNEVLCEQQVRVWTIRYKTRQTWNPLGYIKQERVQLPPGVCFKS